MNHPELPQNIEAERATLGSLLMNRDAITVVASWLTPAMFYLERHAWICDAILHCYGQRIPPDWRTVSDVLIARKQLDDIGGRSYLMELMDAMPTSFHVEFYAREVERLAFLRALINAGGKIAALGYDTDQDADTATGKALSLLDAAVQRKAQRGMTPFARVFDTLLAQMDAGVIPGTPTGFRDLDAYTGGLHDGDLIIVAARPSAGKTSLALNLACNIAGSGGGDVLFFSLEMSKEQIAQRAVAMESGNDLMATRQLRLSSEASIAHVQAMSRLSTLLAFIDDTPNVPVSFIRNQALRHQAERGKIAALFVDYLQLMNGDGVRRSDNRVQEVSAISKALKGLARELNCPAVALSQLSRAVEGRTSKVPMLSDLRESGALEQDADIVLFIYREEMYEPDTDKRGIAELHIAKHRQGPIGVVPLRFDKHTTKFSDLTYRTPDGY